MGRPPEVHPCTGCPKRAQFRIAENQIATREAELRDLEEEAKAIRRLPIRKRLGLLAHTLAGKQRATRLRGEIDAVRERCDLREGELEACPGLFERISGYRPLIDGQSIPVTTTLCGVEAMIEGIDTNEQSGWKLVHPPKTTEPAPLDVPTSGDDQ